jgi:hypothetical protein
MLITTGGIIMKTIIFIMVLLISPIALHSQLPPQGYIGLFTDEYRQEWCAEGEAIYSVEMWMWCLPSNNGQAGVEFGVRYPSNIVLSTFTTNDIWGLGMISGCEGDICYLSGGYMGCMTDWHWIFHETLYVMDSTPSYCEIVPFPESGVYKFMSCLPGHPDEPCRIYTNAYFNYPPEGPECRGTAIESKSWGSIKSMFD